MLMAGEARGAEAGRTPADEDGRRARGSGRPGRRARKAVELALTHQLVTKYASLIAIDRTPARAAPGPRRGRAEKIDKRDLPETSTMQRRYPLEGAPFS